MSIELILGPMFSGKTSELFHRLNRAKYTGQSTIVFKYIRDQRYLPANGHVGPYGLSRAVSHDLIQVNAVPINDFSELSELPDADVIGIDEGQFIGGVPLFAMAAAEAGKRVIISALDSDFRMMPWKNIQRLIPVSERIDKLHAVCFKCKRDASFTKRLDVTNNIVEDIGGSEKYVASCRLCFS